MSNTNNIDRATSRTWRRRFAAIAALLIVSAVLAPAQTPTRTSLTPRTSVWQLHARIPLGTDSLLLQPSKRVVSILASAESPQFEGWRLVPRSQRAALLDASGKPVQALPSIIAFRVTAGTRDKIIDEHPMPTPVAQDLNTFLLGLQFEVQVFRGMDMHLVKPTNTQMIGIPADETAEERIYHVKFDLGDVKPEDRIVLVILDSKGQRLSKFHLEFL
jgi:hypothetical protein